MICQNIKCPFCKNKNIADLPCKNHYSFCRNCHLAFNNKKLTKKYKEEYYLGNSRLASKIFSIISYFFYLRRNKFINKQSQLWIDVGAGDGNYLQTVLSKKKIGVEISASGRLFMKKRGINTMTHKQFLKSKKLEADSISFWHSLEHINNPQKYISTAFKNLKKNGKIIIGVPNIDSLEFAFFKDNWFHLASDYHKWHFSPISIKYLLNNCGFSIDKINYFSFEHHFAGLVQSIINQTSGSSNVLHKLLKRKSGSSDFSLKVIFWCIFWFTFGLPPLILFFLIAVLTKRSGTIVVLATKNN